MIISRRQFLNSGATVVAAGATVPAMLMNLAHARAAENDKSTKDRVLVVFELSGGNDGINTLVPYKDPAYAKMRPTLAIAEKDLNILDAHTGVGLHPSMTGFADLFKNKQLAVIQGAGYPQANRSHFRSMEIWHRGSPDNAVTTGFLGRYYETACAKDNASVVPIIHYGKNRPEIFKAGKAPAMSVNAIDDFYPMNQKPESVAISTLYKNMKAGADPAMAGGPMKPEDVLSPTEIVQATGMDIVKGTEVIKKLLKNPRTPKAEYPTDRSSAGLKVFAQMIVENLGTKLFYVSLGGFDTHARQAEGHSNLMAQLSSSISAFLADLKAENKDKDVMVMVFSEFGRRTKENGSAGTDHGAASVMFFAGGSVKGGLYGAYPSLSDLDDGDLKYKVDFRDCYATLLEHYLGTSADRILPNHKGRLDFV
ncbi:MAG: DUF1501 domain-containing protein [Phycisphaerae bacterium]|nr:DUF1501 domain-containing protein [Tepidisphaeraceae bacterium]